MRESNYICLRYCPQLQHNVIMEGRVTQGGFRLECLNKEDCGYREMGCRNLLLQNRAIKSDIRAEVG